MTDIVAIWLLAFAMFALGWFAHRHQTFWAMHHVRGELEQWIEELCGHLLGIEGCEKLDEIMDGVMRRQRMPPLIRLRRRSPRRQTP